jgi:hypothetical protein
VASLVALAALDTLSRARLRALLGRVTFLLAVPAGVGIDALFRTVAGTMTGLVAVDALDGRLCRLMLGGLLLAVLHHTLVRSPNPYDRSLYLADVSKLAAVAAQRQTTVLDEAGRSKTLEVLLWVLGPALRHLGTTRLRGKLDRENILALGVADEVDDGHVGFNILLLGDQIDTQSILAQSRLDTSQSELLRRSTSIGT